MRGRVCFSVREKRLTERGGGGAILSGTELLIVGLYVILGSGPAAHTAAIYTARAELKPLLFEGKW